MSLIEVQHKLRKADQALYNAYKSEKRWQLGEKTALTGFVISEMMAFSEHVSDERPSSYFPWMVAGFVGMVGYIAAEYKKKSAIDTVRQKEKDIKNLEWQRRDEICRKSTEMAQDCFSPCYTDIVAEDYSEEDGGIQEDIFDASEYRIVVLKRSSTT